MSKILLTSIFLTVWVLYVDCSYDDRAKIRTSNGNLYLEPARGKNIYLRTNGPHSSVFLGDTNLINITERIGPSEPLNNNVETLVYDTSDLLRRIKALEDTNLISNDELLGNVSALSVRMNRISSRLNRLQRQIDGWTGDQCHLHTCQNGGTCLSLVGDFHCLCPPNWEGRNCEIDVNECRNFAGTDLGCQNGADCINKPGTYECQCRTGWFGTHCAKTKMDCSGGSFEMCGHGTCVPVNSGEGIKCICDQGWTTNGSVACLTDVNECDTSLGLRCSTNPKVECINLPGSFRCGQCPQGFQGDGYACYDIDECLTTNGGCSSMVSCHNIIGSRICGACPPGFFGDGITCTWKGSCSIDHGGCHPSARCVENAGLGGGAQCECPRGMDGDGVGLHGCYVSAENGTKSCEEDPCGPHGRCHILRNGYTCFCLRGYTGAHCDVHGESCATNPCKNGGLCRPDDTAAQGFRCECTTQYTGTLCQERSHCGSILRAEEGNLMYPLTNMTYGPNSKCAWIIRTIPEKVINVTFSRFNLERSPDCNFNFLQIHDGRSTADPLIGRFCGNDPPKEGNIVSSQHNLYLWFLTNGGRNGFALHWQSIAPICGGEVNATVHGAISSPGSPGKYPPNRDCYWHLKTNIGKRIQLHFFQLDLEVHTNCNFDYLAIYNGDDQQNADQLLEKYCSSTQPAPLLSTGSEIVIHFHSDAHSSGKGFQISYAPVEGVPGCGGFFSGDKGDITSPSYDGSYMSNLFCEYKIKTGPDTQIQLDFKLFNVERSRNCKRDYLKIFDGPSSESPIIGTFCGKLDRKIMLNSTGNNIFMVFRTDHSVGSDGFKIAYKVLCNYLVRGDSGVIKSPGYPFTYPDNRMCEYIIETSPGKAIQLSFQDFDVEGDADCEFDNVEIRDGLQINSTLLGKYCGNRLPPSQTSTHNIMKVKFYSDMSQSGGGFFANFTTIDVECGGIYKDSVGTISHPLGDSKYKKGQTCTWIILAPPEKTINLNWNRFQLESTHLCTADYLEIYMIDDDNRNTSRKFCGRRMPPAMTITTNSLILKFVTDSSIQDLGFSVTYTFMDKKGHCGGNYVQNHGVIYSPGWPSRYDRNMDCVWTINVSTGQQIKLNISQFDLEDSSYRTYFKCEDFLRVTNGPSDTSPLIGEYCGKFNWKTITSLANTVNIHFHSDFMIGGRGFKIEWDTTNTGCGGTFTGAKGSLSSPNYPAIYNENSECFYRIITNEGSRISLNFSVFELESFCDDYIEIFDGRDPESRMLGRFCRMPQIIETSSNYAFIKFKSDFAINGRGFLLNYHAICNNNVTGSYGVIESLKYPNSYPLNLNCTWVINVPKGSKINATFTNFDVMPSNHIPIRRGSSDVFGVGRGPGPCVLDYLLIGESINSSLKYCGTYTPPQISTSGNKLQIFFRTTNTYRSRRYTGFRLEWLSYGCRGHIKKSYGFLNKTLSSSDQMECEWLIETRPHSSVQLTFATVYMLQTNNCTTDAIEIYNGPTDLYPLLTKFCHDTVTVQSTSNYFLVKLIKNSSLKDVHFTASFNELPSTCGSLLRAQSGMITSKNYPKNYDNKLDCIWTITVTPGYRVTLEFLDIDLNSDGDKCDDCIKLYDATNILNKNYSVIICDKFPQKIYTSKSNTLKVQFVTNKFGTAKGFKANFTMTCGGIITESENGVITNENVINFSNSSCVWTILATKLDQKVSLTITHLSLPITNDRITNQTCPDSYLRVLDGNDEKAPLIDEYCGRSIPATIVSHGSALTVQLGTRNNKVVGVFTAYYSTVTSACGGTLTSESGVIASPNYPAPYPVNAICEWTVKTSPGNRVSIRIDILDIQYSEECNEDYLEVREHDGAGRILGLYCGNVLPINSTLATQVYIKFRSDDKNPGRGFLLHYSFLHGNEFTDLDSGEIASPLYPHPYDSSGVFWWRITSGYQIINIEVDKLQIHSHTETCDDNLSIYDGYNDEAPLLRKLCGALHSKTEIIRTTSNAAYIKLTLNEANEGALFHLLWTQGDNDIDQVTEKPNCGNNSTFTLMPGRISFFNSPNYPKPYDNDQNCEWIYKATQGQHLSLQFSSFDIEEREPCTNGDTVSIFESDRPAEWKPVKENICLQKDAQGIFNASTFMKITFRSDFSYTKKGFFASVKSLCGSDLTEPSGIIEVKMFEYDGNPLRCDWKVKVKPGRRIKLRFLKFGIKNKESCKTYVVLHNGESLESPILSDGKYCGYAHENMSTMITTGNNLFVSYYKNDNKGNQLFSLEYEEMQINCGLTSKFDADHSWEIISSPNYPNVPDPYTECNWLFTGPIGEILRVDFIDRFDIHTESDCISEFVKIHDGSSPLSPAKGTFCGKNPGTIKTTSNSVYIKYMTQLSEPNNGFKANVSIDVCGGTIKSSQGELTSPGYPNTIHLPPGTVCEWHIIGRERWSLSLTPQDMILPESESECATKVTVEELEPVTNIKEVLKTFCTQTILDTSTIQASANNVTVKLYIGKPSQYAFGAKRTGFRLTFMSSRPSCNAEFTTPDGYITTPRYPKTANTEFCHFMITVPDQSRRITLEILDSGKNTLLISEGNFEQRIANLNNYDITSQNNTFKSSGNTMVIFLRNSHDGRFIFKARFTSYEPAVCGGDLSGITGQLKSPDVVDAYFCKWRYHEDSTQNNVDQTMLITGIVNTSDSTTGRKCHYFESQLSIEHSVDIYNKQRQSFCSGPFSYTIPIQNIMFKAKKVSSQNLYFDIQWKLQQCGGNVKVGEDSVNILNIPQSFNDSLDCSWILKTSERRAPIEIKVEGNFQLDCDNEFIKLGQVLYGSPYNIFDYCKDRIQNTPNILSFSNIFINYHSKTNNSNMKVFVRTVIQNCGGALEYPGKFSSPNFPKGYENNLECEWVIKSQEFGFRVSLQFVNRFAIEKSPNCTKDSVIIYDWKDGIYIEVARLCGRELPPVFNSTYDRMKVVMRTDNATNLDGFEAIWTLICGGIYNATTTEQFLYSPGYPYYWPLRTCTYRLSAPTERLQITFLDFNLEGYLGNCESDNLTITSTDDTHYYYEVFCGNEIPKINFMFNEVEIVFNSDMSVQKRGFKMAYSLFSCGGHITEPTMLSSGPLETHGRNMNCTWLIEASKNKKVVLKIVEFQLETSHDCMDDYLAIYEGLNTDLDNRLALFCGDIQPSTVIQNKGNTMTVVFVSDAYIELKGFKADIFFTYSESVGCGGDINITSSSYTLTSPHINSQFTYENFLDCHWNIIAPSDHVIKVLFTSFHIAPCRNINQTALGYSQCDCDFLQIKDGINPDSLVIGTYCGHTMPPEIVASGNSLSIRLTTDGEITSSGFRANLIVQESLCGTSLFNVSEAVQRVKSPGYDTGSIARGIHCAYYFNVPSPYQSIHIHFNDIDLHSGSASDVCDNDRIIISRTSVPSGVLLGKDYIQGGYGQSTLNSLAYTIYNSFDNVKTPEKYLICGSKQSVDLYVSGSFILNVITSPDDVTGRYRGMDIEVSELGFCGRNFTELYARVLNNYAFNSNKTINDCYTLISVPENFTISVYPITIITDVSSAGAYLDIYDGNTTASNKIMRFDNGYMSSDSNPIFSSGRYMLLHNHLASKERIVTYDFTYVGTDKGRGCGGYFYGAEGMVTSPLYPGVYRETKTCEWELETPHGTRVSLHFDTFDLGRDCEHNYVQLVARDGTALSNFCAETPADYTSVDNYVKIVFVTNRNNGGTGWALKFLSVI